MKKSRYLELLKIYNIVPNFYCSQEYLDKSGVEEITIENYIFLQQDDWIISPPINALNGELLGVPKDWAPKIWIDFQYWRPPVGYEPTFLDWEYIYNPKDFLDLSGGNWRVFRKNIRKFPGRYGKAPLSYVNIFEVARKRGERFVKDSLKNLLLEWLSDQGKDEEIHDDDVIVEYLFNGENRKVLIDKDYMILGVNIWDQNHQFINFRYSFSQSHKFLNEYIRYVFYTDPTIIHHNKLVNDGGTLDNNNIESFKDKLCPQAKRPVFSYHKTGEGPNEKE
jgi:hypothetical protein